MNKSPPNPLLQRGASREIRHQEAVLARYDLGFYNAAAHIAGQCARAKRCKEWLKTKGFEVLYTDITGRLPRIYVKPGAPCDLLTGAVHRFERTPFGAEHYLVAERDGCEVRWAERDEGAAP